MATITEIRKELEMINKISKITNAMKIVAISKINRARSTFLDAIDLNHSLYGTIKILLANMPKHILEEKVDHKKPKLWIIYTSSLGMAGSYNINIFKLFTNKYSVGDKVIVFGEKGYKFLSRTIPKQNIINFFPSFEKQSDFIYMKYISEMVFNYWHNKEFGSVNVLYSKFKNTTTYAPHIFELFPLTREFLNEKNTSTYSLPPTSFTIDNGVKNTYDNVIMMYIESRIYLAFSEAKLCEHLSRKTAMIEACKNEDSRVNLLKIAYNKKRQEKITSQVALLSTVL